MGTIQNYSPVLSKMITTIAIFPTSNHSLMSFLSLFTLVSCIKLTDGFMPSTSYATSPNRVQPLFSTITAPVTLPDGLTKMVKRKGDGPRLRKGDVAIVKYNCYVPSDNAEEPAMIFSQSPRQKVIVGGGSMIKGWEISLASMSVGENAVIRIEKNAAEQFGYGSKGVYPLIPPDAIIEMEMEILDSEKQQMGGAATAAMGASSGFIDLGGSEGGSGELANLDPSKPRTPESIAAAFKSRQEIAAKTVELEGLEGFIEKVKSYYFFGFFEGETGEAAPWYLRPSITFPLAFAIVGAAFYLVFAVGGISERGAQVTDELDAIITLLPLRDSIIVA